MHKNVRIQSMNAFYGSAPSGDNAYCAIPIHHYFVDVQAIVMCMHISVCIHCFNERDDASNFIFNAQTN